MKRHSFSQSTALRADPSPVDGDITISQQLCASLGIRETKSIKTAVSTCPKLCEVVESTNLTEWRQQAGRISKGRTIAMIVRHPVLLAQALKSTRIQSIPEIFEQRLGMSRDEYDKMASKGAARPHIWSRPNVRQFLHLFLVEIHLSEAQVVKLVSKHPQLLQPHTRSLRKKVAYLRDELGLDVARMVLRRPMILTYNVSTRLNPTVLFLQSLGSSDWTGWRRMLEANPQLFQYKVETQLQPKLEFLTTLLSRKQDAIHAVSCHPPILWLRPELLQSKMDFLKSALELDDDELRFLVTSFPQLLGLSVDSNLRPTLEFLKQHLTMDQLKEFVAYQPSLLSYSLENRLRPRIQLMQDNAISFGYSPPYLMSLTDDRFQKWVDGNTATWSPLP